MLDFYFLNQNNEKSVDYSILFEEYPVIRMGQEEYDSATIPGKGELYISTGTYSDTQISFPIDINMAGTEGERIEAYLDARKFLIGCKTISFCDTPDYFYKVKYVELGEVDQYSEVAGDFTVQYICEPGVYLVSGTIQYDPDDIELNPYDLCHPTYYITGEGMCTLTVNGKSMTANVGQNLTINTELMLAYRTDGTLQNTAVTGDYEDLYLQSGQNEITITEGFVLKVIPNWRRL